MSKEELGWHFLSSRSENNCHSEGFDAQGNPKIPVRSFLRANSRGDSGHEKAITDRVSPSMEELMVPMQATATAMDSTIPAELPNVLFMNVCLTKHKKFAWVFLARQKRSCDIMF